MTDAIIVASGVGLIWAAATALALYLIIHHWDDV